MNAKNFIGHKQQLASLESMAQNEKIPHAILFSGISGIGKNIAAQLFINSIFCQKEPLPCLKCSQCLQIRGNSHPDFIELKPNERNVIPIGNPQKKEIGSVRWLIDCLMKKSITGKFGVIIDGVDRISIEGQNALLKTIEEPQVGTYIVLISSNKSNILPTILSRSAELSFYPLSVNAVEKIIFTKYSDKTDNARFIAEISGGSMEIALILLKEDYYNLIFDICSEISNFINHDEILEFKINKLQTEIGTDNLINILVNIYRYIYMAVIHGIKKEKYNQELLKIFIDDQFKLHKLIKILLVLRKGMANNLNLSNSLKAMLYSIDNVDECSEFS